MAASMAAPGIPSTSLVIMSTSACVQHGEHVGDLAEEPHPARGGTVGEGGASARTGPAPATSST